MEGVNQPSDVMDALREIQKTQSSLLAAVSSLSSNVPKTKGASMPASPVPVAPVQNVQDPKSTSDLSTDEAIGEVAEEDTVIDPATELQAPGPSSPSQRPAFTSRIILTFVTHSVNYFQEETHHDFVVHTPSKSVSIHFQ